jgi:uncharacterized delta-60 repeat protein
MTRYALLLALVAVPLVALTQVPGSLDMSFNPSDGGQDNGEQFVGDVRAIAVHSNSKIAIIGTFGSYNNVDCKRVALLNADCSRDTLFDPGLGPENGNAYAVAFQPDGRIIIGGAFSTYNGNAANRIVSLLPNGAVDPAFDPGLGPDNSVESVIVQADSKILIGGTFNTYNGIPRKSIARLNADGTLDTTFDPGTGAGGLTANLGSVQAIALQPDGKILISGSFLTYNGVPRSFIARIEADGSLDTTFDTSDGPNNTVRTMALQADGKIVIGGAFSTITGIAKGRVARLNSDGSLDAAFGTGVGAGGSVYSVALQADNKVLVGGTITQYDGISCERIVRLNSDGTVDLTAVLRADNNVQAITVQPNGKILVGGDFAEFNGRLRGRFTRIDPDGSTDPGFYLGTGVNATVKTVTVAQDGKILIGGDFTSVNGVDRMHIARLHADGSLDTGFGLGEGANRAVLAIVPLSNGKMLVGGAFTSYNGVSCSRLIRLLSDGSLDTSFDVGVGPNGAVYAIQVQPDGTIVVAGSFSQFNGVVHKCVARLHEDGSLDVAFVPYPVANVAIGAYSVAVQDDGKILVGGTFTAIPTMKHLARFNTDGSLDTAGFDTGTGFSDPNSVSVESILLLPDGKIMVGGSFRAFNGVAVDGIVRLNSDGSLDDTFEFGIGADGVVLAMVMQADGKVLIGGAFSSYNGVTSERGLALLNADGSLDEGFNDGYGVEYKAVHAIAQQPDGRILIGGTFTSFNTVGRNRITRLHGGDPEWRLRLRVKVYLGGASTGGTMSQRLRNEQLLPIVEPYTTLGYQHVSSGGGEVLPGPEVFSTGAGNGIVDWVVLELRSASSPSTVLATRSALLRSRGEVEDLDGRSSVSFDLPPGNYFVAVRHRNHLGCMTAVPKSFVSGTVVVDLTTSATATWGINARKSYANFNTMALWPGDANFDGRIKYLGANNDRDVVLTTVGAATPQNIVSDVYHVADLNMNGDVLFEGLGNDTELILQSLPNPNVLHTVRVEQIPNGTLVPIGVNTW